MRIWSIHPKYLDTKGLLAVWRETLLAQNVLLGKTKGYKNHPQLERFRKHPTPLKAISAYLLGIYEEASSRGYNFNKNKILGLKSNVKKLKKIKVTKGQIEYEFAHLLKKLEKRDKDKHEILKHKKKICVNPIFEIIEGKIESWEKIK